MNDEQKKSLKTYLWGQVPLVDVEEIPESFQEWRSSIAVAQNRSLPLAMDQRLNALVANDEDMLILALHRVVQRHWRSDHKFPCRLSKEERSAVCIYGDVWWQKLRLCERLHSYSAWGEEYKNAAEWFLQLVLEWRKHGIQSVLTQKIKKGKTTLTELIQKDLKELKEGINPENKCDSLHHWRLMETALIFEGSNDQFRKEFWKPYLESRIDWKNELNSNTRLRCIFLENENFYLPIGGKGKGKVKLFQNLPTEIRALQGFQDLSSICAGD